MDTQSSQEKAVPPPVPVQFVRASRAFRQFKNPPQPHMCIQDTVKDTTKTLYINVLGWQKIANPKQLTDPIPLYGGMQITQSCGPNSTRPPLLVFAVMVNPDILKQNGKNATNASDKQALVSLLCDFIEAMNPGLVLTRAPVILKDRDLTGELKDVWLAIQNKREREKGSSSDVMYKVYDIDGIGGDDNIEEDTNSKNKQNSGGSMNKTQDQKQVKSSKQILMNAGQKSEFDSGMNNYQLNQNNTKDNRSSNRSDITYCTPVYGQIVSTRENHNEINDIQQKFAADTPSSSFRKELGHGKSTPGWDEFSKRNMSSIKNEEMKKQRCFKTEKMKPNKNGKNHYDFFPYFDNKTVEESPSDVAAAESDLRSTDDTKIIIDPMQKLELHPTDNKLCDNKALSSIET